MTSMSCKRRLSNRGLPVKNERQHRQADEGGEHQKHRHAAVLEVALHQVLVDVGGGRPEHRAHEGVDQPVHSKAPDRAAAMEMDRMSIK